MHRSLLALAACAAALTAGAAAARANTFCVTPEASCAPAQTYATVQAALNQAALIPDADTVLLGTATYASPSTAGFVYSAPGKLTLVGQGAGTVLTGPAAATRVLKILTAGSGSSITSLHVEIPASTANGAVGLETGFDTTDVSVGAALPQPAGVTGIRLGNNSLARSTVTIDPSITGGIGLEVGSGQVADVVIGAATGVLVPASAGYVQLDRLRVAATNTGVLFRHGAYLVNSLVRVLGDAPDVGGVAIADVADAWVQNTTIVGSGGEDTYGLSAGNLTNGSGQEVDVKNVVISGFGTSIISYSAPGFHSDVNVDYSDYSTAVSQAGTGAIISGGHDGHHAAPGFVDPQAGDFRLRATSPLIDRGTAAETDLDIRGNERNVDGDGDGFASSDIGAFEYQADPPTGAAVSGPDAGMTGETLAFAGSGVAAEPGDGVTYRWAVDGNAPITGQNLQQTFATAGVHHVVLTVTDTQGATATVDHPVTITAVPAAPPPAVGDPGAAAPPAKGCLAKRRFTAALDRRLSRATVTLAGKRLATHRRNGRLTVRVDLRGREAGVYRLKVDGRTAKGKRLRSTRRLRVCG